jgi:hypothetical protein
MGPVPCLVLVFVDVLLRVLRFAVFLSASHLKPARSLLIVAFSLILSMLFTWSFHKRRRCGDDPDGVEQSRCVLEDIINPFMLLLSPWCMYAALACRQYFTALLYVSLGVLDTIGMTAVFAAPLIGYAPLVACPYDVFGICETDIVPSSCFPHGLAVAFASVWAASVLLWLWAGVVMLVGARRDRMKL